MHAIRENKCEDLANQFAGYMVSVESHLDEQNEGSMLPQGLTDGFQVATSALLMLEEGKL